MFFLPISRGLVLTGSGFEETTTRARQRRYTFPFIRTPQIPKYFTPSSWSC